MRLGGGGLRGLLIKQLAAISRDKECPENEVNSMRKLSKLRAECFPRALAQAIIQFASVLLAEFLLEFLPKFLPGLPPHEFLYG